MTKAKTKSLRWWLIVDQHRKPDPSDLFLTKAGAEKMRLYDETVVPATLTWTPPAKAKRRAKR